jgi:hypothetical protein
VQVAFTPLRGFLHYDVDSLSGITMKLQENFRGVPLRGRAMQVEPNKFKVLLSGAEPEKLLNFKLLNEQAWFDIPIIYGDGLRAIVAVEKGPTGEAAFKDGLSVWR